MIQAQIEEAVPSTLDGLDPEELAWVADAVAADLAHRGVTFGDRPFRVDPVPRQIEAEEWALLERGLTQRVAALNAFIADVYGDREIVRAGVVPSPAIESADHFEPWMLGVRMRALHAPIVGLDVVRGPDGQLRVLEDNVRTPSGFAYAIAARAAVDARLPISPPTRRRALDPALDAIRQVLWQADPRRSGRPVAVMLSDGPSNPAWFEHRQLARALAIPLVTPGDVVRRKGDLFALLPEGERRIDVLYRRTDEDRLREPGGRPTWLAELLLEPIRRGTLAVVNAPGAGVADDKLIHAYADRMIRFYLQEEPSVPSVPTFDLTDLDVRLEALGRIDELVVKPRAGHGGAGIVVCPHAEPEDRRRAARLVRQRPDRVIAQETVMLSRHPTVIDGQLEPRHVDLRVFVADGKLLPLALTRVAFGRDALVVNSSQNGGAKDTWVMA
jgi:uncharacterized circularly permuted ATP-grasp superfamily protein